MSSKISHSIKQRTKSKVNDVFLTPLPLAKLHIDMIEFKENERWLDPCKNSGNYFNQFPNENRDYCEILENKDFFTYSKPVDIIVQNPPYSMLDAWFKKNIELKPRIFSMLIGIANLTARRVELCQQAGYGLTKMKMLKVYKWYGMSVLVVFEQGKDSIIEINRKVWR